MRIISGKYGGRRLVNFKASHIRPTTDRVKESVFNILRDYIDGARVLDLFAGTGNLSIEALSREASHVTAVEKNPKSLAIIQENKELLKIKDELFVVRDDVLRFLKRYEGEPYDLILIDPPFTEKMGDEVLQVLAGSAVLGPNTRIMIEWSAHEQVVESYPGPQGAGGLRCVDRRDFGDKMVSFFEPA